jgi:Metallo-peptidase family M12/Bacterial Ig domain/Secretion system C-terminal sorting domain
MNYSITSTIHVPTLAVSKTNFFTFNQTFTSFFVLFFLSISSILGQDLKPVAHRIQEVHLSNQTFASFSFFTPKPNSTNQFSKLCADVTTADLTVSELKKALVSTSKAINLKIPYKGQSLSVDLIEADNMTEDFQVYTSASNKLPVDYEKGKHFRGIVAGDNNSIASFSIFKNELMGIVSIPNVGNIVVARLDNAATEYVIYNDNDMKVKMPTDCHTPDTGYLPVGLNLRQSPQALIDKCTRIYLEADYAMFVNKGSVANATNYLTAIFNNVATLYANEQISVTLSTIYVWTTPDSYSTTSSSTAMSQFQTVRPTFNGDLAQLVALGGQNTGGIAWVDGLCNAKYGYSYANVRASYSDFPTFSWSVEVVTHELGHNFGSPHTHACSWTGGPIDNCYAAEGSCAAGPTPVNGGTIMSYCHLVSTGINFSNGFGTLPGGRIRSRVTNATCLAAACVSSGNNPPTVSITAPANNANFTPPASISITASAADADGSVTQVAFYNGTTLLGTDLTAPYAFSWTNVALGTYSLTAVATDNTGAKTTSAIVYVIVNTVTTTTCKDVYEPNNILNQSIVLPIGTGINGTISVSNDNDYFRFTTTNAAPKVKLTLSNLPADYSLRLYRVQGYKANLVAISSNSGTTAEVIAYNTQTVATMFIVLVSSNSGAFSTTQCYSLLAQTSNTSFMAPTSLGSFVEETKPLTKGLGIKLSPNPTSDNVQVDIETLEAGLYNLTVYDAAGKMLQTKQVSMEEGEKSIQLDLTNYASGMYLVKFQNDKQYVTAKLLIH